MDTIRYTQVLVDGKIYLLGGSEDEAYLQKAAGYVNEKLARLRRIPGFLKQNADYQMAMIELNMADDYYKALERAEGLKEQKDALEKETYSLKHELISTQMKLEAVLHDLEARQRELEEARRELEDVRKEAVPLKAGKEADDGKEASPADSGDGQDKEAQAEEAPLSQAELAKRALAAAKKAGGVYKKHI